jgi:hypothetical protein
LFDQWVTSGLATPIPEVLDQAIQFDKRFGSKQMNTLFRALLPTLFNWFAKINPQVLTVPDEPDNVGIPLNTTCGESVGNTTASTRHASTGY